jgi:hypothetical protein
MNLNDPTKAVPVPNSEKLEVLEGYYATPGAVAKLEKK